MRFALPLILGLVTLADGVTFTFGHYRTDTLIPFAVLQPLLPPGPHSWLTPQHVWGILYLIGAILLLLPIHPVQRGIGYVYCAMAWGGFAAAMLAQALFLDPHHQTGGATGATFLGFAVLHILGTTRLMEDWRKDRAVLNRWCACVLRRDLHPSRHLRAQQLPKTD